MTTTQITTTQITARPSEGQLFAADQVVGNVEQVACHLVVGNGQKVHHGDVTRATVTVAFDEINRYGMVTRHYAVGDTFDFEPIQHCGTVAYGEARGYSNGYRYTNRQTDADVTCAKCLAKTEAETEAAEEAIPVAEVETEAAEEAIPVAEVEWPEGVAKLYEPLFRSVTTEVAPVVIPAKAQEIWVGAVQELLELRKTEAYKARGFGRKETRDYQISFHTDRLISAFSN